MPAVHVVKLEICPRFKVMLFFPTIESSVQLYLDNRFKCNKYYHYAMCLQLCSKLQKGIYILLCPQESKKAAKTHIQKMFTEKSKVSKLFKSGIQSGIQSSLSAYGRRKGQGGKEQGRGGKDQDIKIAMLTTVFG